MAKNDYIPKHAIQINDEASRELLEAHEEFEHASTQKEYAAELHELALSIQPARVGGIALYFLLESQAIRTVKRAERRAQAFLKRSDS